MKKCHTNYREYFPSRSFIRTFIVKCVLKVSCISQDFFKSSVEPETPRVPHHLQGNLILGVL